MSGNIVIPFRVSQDAKSGKWEAVLIAPGVSKSKPAFNWTERVLEAAVPLFEGVDINAYEIKGGYFGHVPDAIVDVKQYLTASKAAKVSNVRYKAGAGVVGDISFSEKFGWVPESLAGDSDFLGLSIDARVVADFAGIEPIEPTEIKSVDSVDIVTRPAAGGKFLRAVAALEPSAVTGGFMDKEKLIKMIQDARPELLTGKDTKKMSAEEIEIIARQAMAPVEEPEPKPDPEPAPAPEGTEPVDGRAAQAALDAITEKYEARLEARTAMSEKLNGSELPDIAKERVRQSLGDDFKPSDVAVAIKAEKEYLAKMSTPGFDMPEQGRADVGIGEREKLQIACDLMFGLSRKDIDGLKSARTVQGAPIFPDVVGAEDYDTVVPPSGIRELYVMMTGDTNIDGTLNRANMSRDMRAAQADFSASVFDIVLGNTMARRLSKDYREANYHENRIISVRKSVRDFRTQDAVMVGYFGDLDTVAERAAYTEFDEITDLKSSYAVAKYGNLLAISREQILNDDISLVARLVKRAGRAARRTHAKVVWNPFIANSNCADGNFWFTVGHNNLGSAAMSFATVSAAYDALAAMTEQDSGEKIGWLDDTSVKPCLVHPSALRATAQEIAEETHYFTGVGMDTRVKNSVYGLIDRCQLSLLGDVNDWGLLMPPSEGDLVEVSYLNGRREPEIFLANKPTMGTTFTNDVITYKLRFEFGRACVDYRTAYKAVVA